MVLVSEHEQQNILFLVAINRLNTCKFRKETKTAAFYARRRKCDYLEGKEAKERP